MTGHKKYSNEDIQDLYDTGLSMEDTAKLLNITKGQVRYAIRGKARKNPVSDMIDPNAVINQLNSGRSIQAVANNLGVNFSVIKRITSKLPNGTIKNRCQIKKEYWEKFNPLGKLTLLDVYQKEDDVNFYARCLCSCGKEVNTRLRYIGEGKSTSCGRGGCFNRGSNDKIRLIELAKDAP